MGAARNDEDWELIRQTLPAGWEEAAAERGAVRRVQGPLAKPEALLRVLLGKAAGDKSNREAAAEAGLTGLAQVSDVAIHKREKQSGDWLEWIADGLLEGTMDELPQGPFRLRLVDATTASVPGSDGTNSLSEAGRPTPEAEDRRKRGDQSRRPPGFSMRRTICWTS